MYVGNPTLTFVHPNMPIWEKEGIYEIRSFKQTSLFVLRIRVDVGLFDNFTELIIKT